MNYEQVKSILSSLSTELDASAFHGRLTALICTGCDEEGVDDWLPTMLTGGYVSDEDYTPLAAQVADCCREIRGDFEEDGFNFTVLLPGDEESLESRVESLNRWCIGFLEGLESAELLPALSMLEECQEIINDIQITAVVELDPDDSEDEQEFALTTIFENTRVAVQLFYEVYGRYAERKFEDGAG